MLRPKEGEPLQEYPCHALVDINAKSDVIPQVQVKGQQEQPFRLQDTGDLAYESLIFPNVLQYADAVKDINPTVSERKLLSVSQSEADMPWGVGDTVRCPSLEFRHF